MRRGKGLAIWLGALQAFIGLGALAGGLGLVSDPTGANLGLPADLLESTPFSSYLVPGIVLFTINGAGSLLGSVATFRRLRWAGETAMALGAFLVAWILAQIYWFAGVHWLHALYLGLGSLELVLGWSLRRAPRGEPA
jgi:hypothetical protein